MLFYTVGQSRVFLTMLYAGLAIGLYLSLDGALRRLFEAGRWLHILMDLLFGTVLAGILILKDAFTLTQLLGILLILVSVFGVTWQSGKQTKAQ